MSALSNWKALPLDKQANNLTGGKTRIYYHKKVNPKKVAKPSGLRRERGREGRGDTARKGATHKWLLNYSESMS